MSAIRRALFLASGERYIVVLINLAMVPIIARLMGPAEFGISVLGMAALAIAEAVRDFGGTAYIIQERNLTTQRVRTSFTITLIWTLILAAALLLVAGPLASFYGVPGVHLYLSVVAISYMAGPFVAPLFALLRRDLEFGKIAAINVTTTTIYAVAAISFAAFGHSFMSFAWANVISVSCSMLLAFYFRPEFKIFRISFTDWRKLVHFGGYQTGAYFLSSLWDYIPYLIMGRLIDVAAIGIYQRAITLCNLPRKALLGGVASIILPAFAASLRDGGDLRSNYLRAVTLITGVSWPSLALLAILAHPIVAIVLGSQWEAVSPIASIVATALMFNFAVDLTYSALLAGGAYRSVFVLYLIIVPLSTLVIYIAAHYGITAVAASMFIIVPLEVLVSQMLVRRMIPYSLRALFAALWPSFLLTLFSVAGPWMIIAAHGWNFELPLLPAGMAILTSGIGWLIGLRVTRHPLFEEMQSAIRAARGRWQRRMSPPLPSNP